MSDQARDLMSKFLKYNPTERLLAKEALEHPYFDGVEKVVGI